MEYSKILGRLLAIYEKVTSTPRLYMDAFETFEDIPPQHRRFLDLAYWLTLKDRSIEQIPDRARTDRLTFFHLGIKPHRHESITPASKRYYAFCEFAMWRTCEVVPFIPVVFITESLVRRLTLGDSRHATLEAFKKTTQFDHLFTKDLVNLTLNRTLWHMREIANKGALSLVSLEVVTTRLNQAHYEFEHLVRYGDNLLEQAIRSGFWFKPTTPDGDALFGDEPKTPAETLLLWESVRRTWAAKSRLEAEWVCAYKMNCFDDAEVIHELLKTNSGRKFLQYFYSDDRVRVFFDSSQAVRGYILEQDLAV